MIKMAEIRDVQELQKETECLLTVFFIKSA